MKFKRKTWEEIEAWHSWFAWYPVPIGDRMVWLERKKDLKDSSMATAMKIIFMACVLSMSLFIYLVEFYR